MNNIKKVALDIGNNEIKLLVGEINSNFDKLEILDYVKVKSKGIRKSIIEDVDALTESLQEAVKEVENKGFQIEKLSLGLAGSNVISSTVNVKLKFPEKEITEADMEELYAEAKRKIFAGRESLYRILYTEIYNKRLDSPGIVKQPIGMVASELQADVHLVYVEDSYVEKFLEIINKIGIDVERVYLSSYVAAKGTLDDETKKKGVALVDIGYSNTNLLLMKNGKVLYTKSLAIGEWHYISDLSYYFEISIEEAKEVFEKFKNKEFENDNTIKLDTKKISLRKIKDAIMERTLDVLKFITRTIENSGFNGHLAKGIVLTGGTVALDGVSESISAKSGYIVRKIKPIEIKGLENPGYSEAVVIGIFLEDMEREYREYVDRKTNSIEEVENNSEEVGNNRKKEEIDEILEDDEEFEEEKADGFFKKLIRDIVDLF